MGDFARKTLARSMAVFGLTATIAIGMGGIAQAAPSDRANDPVVLKGDALPKLNGADPGKVVAFKWNGGWVQVPVQVDERHVVSVRGLYPETAPAYVNNTTSFDVEMFADEKTRSGADENPTVDADDEVVFMGGDTGSAAPKGAPAPKGVDAKSATRINVNDSVGGGAASVYLFKATGALDQTAGKDYVNYNFKLVNFTAGQSLINDYGFSNSNNPEDSTVTTDNYELHSTDRWNEDEMKIKVGGASGADFLDREAVSAGGLGRCSRSEYTFSGNWDRGSDNDEGTYIAIKDGAVRAIRSYMGANSGPYVQDNHLYYADRQDRSIEVRVHPIPEMFVWTDYSDAAVGMTYRDQKNTAGVTIDGVPDTLEEANQADFENGKYLWQQVAGTHGSVTTLVSAHTAKIRESDIGKFSFGSYYLDKTNPSTSSGDRERQCGGDMKAYGASGFGINGMFPNTDPILSTTEEPARMLSVDRIRYFGAPEVGATEADALRARVQDPLAPTVAAASVKPRSVALKTQLKGGKARRGKTAKLKVVAKNTGSLAISSGKVCVRSNAISGSPCAKTGKIAAGKSRNLTIKVKVKRNVKGKRLKLNLVGQFKGEGVSGKKSSKGSIPLRG